MFPASSARKISALSTSGVLLLLGLLVPAPADAAIVFGTGTISGVENVRFAAAQTGVTISGQFNSWPEYSVLFSQPVLPEMLTTGALGQAVIEPVDGLGMTSVRTQLVGDNVFNRFDANVEFLQDVLFTVVTDDGTSHTFSGSTSGQNRFYVIGTEGTTFRYIDIIAPANSIESVRQFRMGGMQPAAVPEPSTWMMLTMGLAVAFGIARRQRARQQLALEGLA